MKKRKIVILNTIAICEKPEDRYKIKDIKDIKDININNINKNIKIYKPSLISLSDEQDIIIPYLSKTNSFKKALDGIKHVRMCNDLRENGPEACDTDSD